jgi:exosome complex component RRP4
MMVEDEDEVRLVATTCGVVQRLNKLVMVRPYKSRYVPEIGDVVVGRVTEIQARRWAVDIGARPQSSLQLSAVELPGGIQRRRTQEDELNMRQVFREGDIIATEVRALRPLHARRLCGPVRRQPGEESAKTPTPSAERGWGFLPARRS